MLILRRISSKGVEMNFTLGDSYTLIHRDFSPDEFNRTVQDFKDESEDIYAFVSNDDGNEVYRLYSNQRNYIMTESGATFSNLTCKS